MSYTNSTARQLQARANRIRMSKILSHVKNFAPLIFSVNAMRRDASCPMCEADEFALEAVDVHGDGMYWVHLSCWGCGYEWYVLPDHACLSNLRSRNCDMHQLELLLRLRHHARSA